MAIYSLGEHIPRLGQDVWVAENATIVGKVELGDYVSIWFNAVIRGDNDPIVIGAHSNIQDSAVLHNDEGIPLTIGSHVTVGHKAMLHGCTVGDHTLIGINAVVLNNAVIGSGCIIGANALIPEGKVIPDNSLVVGSPGRILRTVTDETRSRLLANASHYVLNAERYRRELRQISA